MAEPTMLEIGQAVDELRKEVEKKSLDPAKIDKINIVLDGYEKKNQELVTAVQLAQSHELQIKELKDDLEKKGFEAGKIREETDRLTLLLAKQTKGGSDDSWRDAPETKAFESYVKDGFDRVEKKALRTDGATDGGVLVTNEMEGVILKKIIEIDPIRAIARVRPISTKSLSIATRTGIPTAAFEGEAELGTDSQSTYGSETITAFRLTHSTGITRDMLMDSAFNMETEILGDSGTAFAFGEGNGFVVGTGFKQPQGFLKDPDVIANKISSLVTGSVISPLDFFKVQGELKTGYNGTWIMNRRTLASIRSIRDGSGGAGTGQFLWQPGYQGNAMATLAGDPYVLSNSMPDQADTAYPIAYGDFRVGYLIVDRTAVEVIRDDYSLKKYAIVEFTMHRWVTGKVIMPEAIKILQTHQS